MTPSEFFRQFSLHDSVVDQIRYDPDKRTLVFRVEFCNDMQSTYKENEPQTSRRWLVFTGVDRLGSNIDLKAFAWGPNVDGEILKAEMPAFDEKSGSCTMKIVVSVSNYAKKTQDILVLDFVAGDAILNLPCH